MAMEQVKLNEGDNWDGDSGEKKKQRGRKGTKRMAETGLQRRHPLW